MAEPIHLLQELPDQLASSVRTLPSANYSLLKNSLQRMIEPSGGLKEQLVLRKFGMNYYFCITKSSSGRLFFFINRKKRDTETVVDVNVDFQVQPVSDGITPLEAEVLPINFFWRVPPFLVLDPERQRLELTGMGSESSLCLTNGFGHYLVVDFGDKGDSSDRIWYQGKEQKMDAEGLWLAEPFFIIYLGIRGWMSGSWNSKEVRTIKLNREREVDTIVEFIAKSYKSTRSTLAASQAKLAVENPWRDVMEILYDATDYRSEIVLRLDESGQVAHFDSPEAFQFGLDLSLSVKAEHYEAMVDLGIPDFLIEGTLYKAFWKIFTGRDSENIRTVLLRELKENGYQLNEEQLLDLLKQGEEGKGTVFRIDRYRKIDINLFIVSGKVDGRDVHLLFSGEFQVENAKLGIVTMSKKASKRRRRARKKQKQLGKILEVLYWPKLDKVDDEVAIYFLRLARYFKNWTEI